MAPLRTLIIGGGISGPALAFWLGKLGHQVTVVERFPSLRDKGQQIDIRGQGLAACRKMGLLDTIHAAHVEEEGILFVNDAGQPRGFLAVNRGEGAQSFTSEYEIMRGDLCRILHDASVATGNVQYVFGTTVDAFEQEDSGGRDAKTVDGLSPVKVTFSDGRTAEFDLVVGADGQSSRTRRLLLGLAKGQRDPTHRFLGVYAGFYSLPQDGTERQIARVHHGTGGRVTMTRVDNPRTRQVYHMVRASPTNPLAHEFGVALARRDVAAQRQIMAEMYRDAGWRCAELTDGLLGAPEADDFYATEVASIISPFWHKGRVVLLGDAGYSSATLSGFGTSMGLIGAYVLAGELARATAVVGGQEEKRERSREASEVDVGRALRGYEDCLRPFVDDSQIRKLPIYFFNVAMPETAWGCALLRFVFATIAFLRIDKLFQMFSSDDKGSWKMPDYPELDALI